MPWLATLVAILLWITLIYGSSVHALRGSHRIAKDDLVHLLQTAKPEVPGILDAFDRATEHILFSVLAPQMILTVSVFFFIAHLVSVKRRLNAAERNIQILRDVVSGIDGVPLR